MYMYDGKANVPKDVIHVTGSSSVLEIPSTAFKDCEKLETIKLSSPLFCIGYSAFYRCHKLTKIVILSSVISIGDDAFFGCFGLEESITWKHRWEESKSVEIQEPQSNF